MTIKEATIDFLGAYAQYVEHIVLNTKDQPRTFKDWYDNGCTY